MKTVSVSIENLCVPCHCGCRHCLLDSRHCATGVDYERGKAFAARFYDWMKRERPDLGGMYYVGYCNEFPQLREHIAFVKSIMPSFDFLQFNGMAFRREPELRQLLESVKGSGIRLIDLTFYGTEAYHDRFAGRAGDFRYLLTILKICETIELDVVISVALTMENRDQMAELFELLSHYKYRQCTVFLPHAKGRGEALSGLRLTDEAYASLPEIVRYNFMRIPHRTETEWIERDTFPEADRRALTLALTPENMDRLEQMEPGQIIRELEAMDDAYYGAIPSVAELARMYGRPDNKQLFRLRDLYLQWQKRYLREHSISVPDMNDERHSFSIRLYDER